jgi:hypothetical protein
MKSIISTILFALVLTTGLFAQQTIKNEKHQRILTHVEGNIFDVTFYDNDGNVVQEGQYWKEGEAFIPHGIWLLFSLNSDEVVTKATYNKGEQLMVETVLDGKVLKADNTHKTEQNSTIL